MPKSNLWKEGFVWIYSYRQIVRERMTARAENWEVTSSTITFLWEKGKRGQGLLILKAHSDVLSSTRLYLPKSPQPPQRSATHWGPSVQIPKPVRDTCHSDHHNHAWRFDQSEKNQLKNDVTPGKTILRTCCSSLYVKKQGGEAVLPTQGPELKHWQMGHQTRTLAPGNGGQEGHTDRSIQYAYKLSV